MSECRVKGRVNRRGQESKARAMPRARVQGHDQGQSARSGSGSEVSGEESEVTTIPKGQSARSGSV